MVLPQNYPPDPRVEKEEHQMTIDMNGVRPSVISNMTSRMLGEYRRFRHLVRNIYTINLLPDRLDIPVSNLDELWNNMRPELSVFADFLDELANTNGE